MRRLVSLFAPVVCLAILHAPRAARADADTDKAVQKTLNTLITGIRYGKDDLAARQLAFGTMARELMGDDWAKLAPAEQTEVTKGLETVIRGLSFPKGRDMFKYLDALLFDPSRVKADEARVRSTIVVHRDLKKAEVVIEWVLVRDGPAWKVLDTVMLGESTLQSLRDEQVRPLLKKGGTPAVLQALRDKVAEVKKS